jgi:Ala-tRNA(Pro) deacylase
MSTTLIETLAERRVEYELLAHRRTATAAAEARALGIPPQETAKTVVIRTPRGFARAIVPASRRVDPQRVADALQVPEVAIATEAELAGAYPEFELGAVPPFDAKAEDEVVVDVHLAGTEYVVFEAGTHTESVRLRSDDLIALADARVAAICEV